VAAAARLERCGELAVQRAPAQPRHVLVDRVARERVPERRLAGRELDDQAAGHQLVEPGLAVDRREQLDVEAHARHRRRLGGHAPDQRQVAGAQQHGVADRLRQRDGGVERQLEPVGAGLQAPAGLESGGELLDEERDAVGAVVQRGGEPLAHGAAEHVLGQRRGATRAERLDRELPQHAVAAQLVAQPPQRMGARDLVRPVGGEHEDRQLAQRAGQRGQQLECRVVGPLQVVEQHDGGPVGGHLGQAPADRLEQRGAVALFGGAAELGEEQREVAAQRPVRRQRLGHDAHEPAERRCDRPVREAARAGGAAQEVRVRRRDGLLGEARLADAGLAGQQHQRAAATERGGQLGLEPRAR
jgi:hypothetical protein